MKARKIIAEMGGMERLCGQIFELLTPRDRKGSFEPQIVKKRQTTELEAKVLSTFASGMGYRVHMLRKYMTTKYQQQRYLVLPINCYQ